MKIVGITDIHGRSRRAGQLSETIGKADLVLVAGDITNFGGRGEAQPIIRLLRRINHRIYAVPGNCDHPVVGAYLEEEGITLEGACALVEDCVLVGAGGSLSGPVRTPNEHREEDFERMLSRAASCAPDDKTMILVSHQPPRNTVNDLVRSGHHVGSDAVRRFIEENVPAVCLCGHIHEGVGIDRIGPTVTVNPGPFHRGRYAVVELEGGQLREVSIVRDGQVVQQVEG